MSIILLPLLLAAGGEPAVGQDCLRWVPITGAGGPGQRMGHAMAYDSDRGVTVLFGGRPDADTEPINDQTWEYDGVTWQVIPITGARPTPREYHAMAYDAARKEVVMVGGFIDEGVLGGGTWTYKGDGITGSWTRRFPALDPIVGRHAMVYDSVRQVVVSHGGFVCFNEFCVGETSETFEWDGLSWRSAYGGSLDFTRAGHSMAYDATRGLSILFGGGRASLIEGELTYSAGTWQYNDGIWTQAPSGTPPLRWGAVMAYDSRRNKIVMHGGLGPDLSVASKTDEYAPGVGWTSLFDVNPPNRWERAMVYDSRRGVMVLYGGSAGGFGTWDDTWELADCCVCGDPGWVDFRYAGEEQGTFEHPYNTLAEGMDHLSAGATLKIKAGTTSERPTLTKPMTLAAYGGPVTIGH